MKCGFKYIVLALLIQYIEADLYNVSDPMSILTVDNFEATVLNSSSSWIIEFYNTWCGHCIKYAPTWLKFSRQVEDWQPAIRVGVIDCSDEENVPICRDQEIVSFPTIRLFPLHATQGELGETLQNRTVGDLKNSIVEYLTDLQANGTMPTIPNLLPLSPQVAFQLTRVSFLDILPQVPATAAVAVLIEEADTSTNGHQTILALQNFPQLYVRRFVGNPSTIIHVVKRDRSYIRIETNVTSADDQLATIKDTLGLLDTDDQQNTGSMFNVVTDNYDDVFNNSIRDQVYLVDIENAISYALTHEVVLKKSISGQPLKALTQFVEVLVKYLPSRWHVHNYLNKYHQLLVGKQSIDGGDLSSQIRNMNTAHAFLDEQRPWVGCKPSNPKYRGYPCALWTTFHTLTVNAFLESEPNSYDPRRVLEAIHGYVKHFFSCSHCSQHFQDMYAVDAEEKVKASNDGIMWLWKSHNEVNMRLKGDLSEDPRHKKILFPSITNCPQCWNSDQQFQQDNVLKYLKMIYGRNALSFEGLQNVANLKGSMKQRLFVQGQLPQHSSISSANIVQFSSILFVIAVLSFVIEI